MDVRVCASSFPQLAVCDCEKDHFVTAEKWHCTVWLDAVAWYLEIPIGFETDGASIPRFLWTLCGHPMQKPRLYAALVHDWLYEEGSKDGWTRREADMAYRAMLVQFRWRGRFSRLCAALEYYALRMFGASRFNTNTNTNTKEKEQTK